MILRKNRNNTDTLIIDASKGFVKEGKNNKLRASDIKKIVDTVIKRESVHKFSKVVTREEIRENDYNLNIPRYVDSSEDAETFDIYSLMNGGIPKIELDKFNKYFDVFPNLKRDLFKNINDDYYELSTEELHELILNHKDIINYKNSYKDKFSDFDSYLNEELITNMDNVDISSEEDKISNSMFNRIENVELVDKYNAYQILDDNWNVISGDLELIKSEGIEACNKVDPVMEIKKKNDKETEVQVGVKGHVIPFELVIDYKLKDLKNNVIDKENRLNDIESRISELFDNLSEDEKTEIESILTEENDAFVAKEVAKKAKEYLKQSLSEGTVEKKVIEVNNLFEEQKKLNKEIKNCNNEIEIETQKEIENLTYDDICYLLNKKWIIPIIEGIDKFINNNNIKIQTLNFTCNKGQCSFTGLNDISCHWFQNNNIKELQVYSPCSLIFINDIFDNKIYTTADIFFILAAESELVEKICTQCTNNAVPAVYDFSVFKNIIESTKKMCYRNKIQLPFKLDMYKRRFKNNINAQKELLLSSSF